MTDEPGTGEGPPIGQGEAQGQTSTEERQEGAKKPEEPGENEQPQWVRFLNIEHGPEKADEIWKKAKDADIILVEAIGKKEDRDAFELSINEAARAYRTASGADFTPRPKVANFRWLSVYVQRIVGRAIKAGKELHFIDAVYEDPEAVDAELAIATLDWGILEDLSRGTKAGSALERYISAVEGLARSSHLREEKVLADLTERVPNLRGKKVAVIQGALHSAVYHGFVKTFPQFKTERLFSEMPFVFGPEVYITLIRKRMFKPEEHIPREEYIKGFLLDELFKPDIMHMLTLGKADPLRQELKKAVNQMSPEELESLIKRYEELRKDKLEEDLRRRLSLPDNKMRYRAWEHAVRELWREVLRQNQPQKQ